MLLEEAVAKIKNLTYYKNKILGLENTGKSSFSGLIGSARSFLLASLATQFKNLFIIASTTEQAERLKKEIEFFSSKKVTVFPAPDTLLEEEIQSSKELVGERLSVLDKWLRKEEMIVVAPVKAVMLKTSSKFEVRSSKLEISVAAPISSGPILIEKLINLGYKRFDIVGERGEFSVRGGIVDIFPLNRNNPVRLELVEDKVESLRTFDPYSQRSIEKISEATILPVREKFEVPVFEYLSEDVVVVLDEVMDISRVADRIANVGTGLVPVRSFRTTIKVVPTFLNFEEIQELIKNYKVLELSSFLKPEEETIFISPPSYLGKLAEVPKEAIMVSRHAVRLREEFPENQVFLGDLQGGFVVAKINLTVLSDKELFGEEIAPSRFKALPAEGVADELLVDLRAGDYVVHENYGIGIFAGMRTLEWEGVRQEYFLIEYADEDKLYVPPTMMGLVEKYSGGGEGRPWPGRPKLSRLGTQRWFRTKERVKNSLKDLTSELLELYAARKKLEGFACPADDLYQVELEETFPYEETTDQKKAILDTKHDMESSKPMDRLVCGDVGYGKTEVAIRTAIKAVSAGKQVAVLVPTTILAEQHYHNFKSRFQTFPFTVEMLSRFRSKKEQEKIVKALAAGGIDVVIGTHRLLQKDIKFKDMGLLIIDEEQHFGVTHKEKLKKLKINVDVLTLTATPIPRTLYLSLSGTRDMSLISTPPIDRSPIRTYVLPWSETVIREAILRELDRGGQVYFVHNFIETIQGMASKVRKLIPEAKITIAHGKMPEEELEKTMLDFLNRKFDVLICTSIIEAGLDIANVNTLIVDQADRFGLAQLYQIRGRVGRSAVRAHAYLFYHPARSMTDAAVERLKAIQEFTALGSGYKLAMRDLEIRGAGNLLGREQSGHILEVGFDLYCELLEEAVREIKGEKLPTPHQVQIDLKASAYIPSDYIPDERQRMAIYRRMNNLSTLEEVDDLKKELVDRFGKIPAKLEKLFEVLYLKVKALSAGVKSIKEEKGKIQIEWLSGKVKELVGSGVKIAEKGMFQ